MIDGTFVEYTLDTILCLAALRWETYGSDEASARAQRRELDDMINGLEAMIDVEHAEGRMCPITYSTMPLPDGQVRAYVFPRKSPEQIVREIDGSTIADAARAAEEWIKVEYGQATVRPF